MMGPALTGGEFGDCSDISITVLGEPERSKFGGLKSAAFIGAFEAGEAGRLDYLGS